MLHLTYTMSHGNTKLKKKIEWHQVGLSLFNYQHDPTNLSERYIDVALDYLAQTYSVDEDAVHSA